MKTNKYCVLFIQELNFWIIWHDFLIYVQLIILKKKKPTNLV